jgi:hypothetical protein
MARVARHGSADAGGAERIALKCIAVHRLRAITLDGRFDAFGIGHWVETVRACCTWRTEAPPREPRADDLTNESRTGSLTCNGAYGNAIA